VPDAGYGNPWRSRQENSPALSKSDSAASLADKTFAGRSCESEKNQLRRCRNREAKGRVNCGACRTDAGTRPVIAGAAHVSLEWAMDGSFVDCLSSVAGGVRRNCGSDAAGFSCCRFDDMGSTGNGDRGVGSRPGDRNRNAWRWSAGAGLARERSFR